MAFSKPPVKKLRAYQEVIVHDTKKILDSIFYDEMGDREQAIAICKFVKDHHTHLPEGEKTYANHG